MPTNPTAITFPTPRRRCTVEREAARVVTCIFARISACIPARVS